MEKKNKTIIYLIFVLMLIIQLWIGYMFFKKWSNDRYTFSKKSSSIGLIDELYKDLKSISLKKTTRDDIKFQKKDVVHIKNQRFLV